MNTDDLLEVLRRVRVIAMVRAPRLPEPHQLAACLLEAGAPVVELTLTTPGALLAIEAARSMDEVVVGAGTVKRPEDVEACVAAGAQFLVTPYPVSAAADAAEHLGCPMVIGALTPFEVARAAEMNPAAVKIFPARIGGPAYISDLLGPMPDLALVPSGGIDDDNAAAYLSAGAVAVTAGTSVVRPQDVVECRYDAIRDRVAAFRASLGGDRGP